MSLKVPIKQQPFAHQVSFCSSRNNFLQGGGGVNIYVLSQGVRPVENKWKGVDCETLFRTQQKPGDEADAGKRTQPTLARALQVGRDFKNDLRRLSF